MTNIKKGSWKGRGGRNSLVSLLFVELENTLIHNIHVIHNIRFYNYQKVDMNHISIRNTHEANVCKWLLKSAKKTYSKSYMHRDTEF